MKPKALHITLLTIWLLLIAGGLALFLLIHRHLNAQISKMSTMQADLVLENERIKNLEDLQKQYESIKPLAEKVQTILPAEKQQAEVVAQIESIVKSSGLSINSITFENTSGLPSSTSQTKQSSINGLLSLPLSFQTTGTYPQLQNVLQKFERQERYMQVSNLGIIRTTSDQLSFNVTLEVFLRP